MKQFTADEISLYDKLRRIWLAEAECWLSKEERQDLKYALSEPSIFAIVIARGEEKVIKSRVAIWSLPVAKRKRVLNHRAYGRYEPVMKDAMHGIAWLGQRGYTANKIEAKIAKLIENEYEGLKALADINLAGYGIDNAGDQVIQFFWESITRGKELPTRNKNIRDSLNWKSNNLSQVFERLLWLVNNPESDEFKRVATSMILSYLREYHDIGKGRKEIINIDDYVSTEELLNRGRNRTGSKREFEELREFEEIGEREALEELLGFIRNEKDRKVVELALGYREQKYTTKQIEDDLKERYPELELGSRGYRIRLQRMRDKYPDLIKRLEKQ